MKILHVAPYFAPAWAYGGTPRAVYQLAKNQVKLGHQVWVITTDANTQNKRTNRATQVMSGIQVLRVKNLSNWLCWYKHFLTPSLSWNNIKTIIKNNNFDVIHFHETRTLLHVFVLILLKKGTPVVLSPWGTLPLNNSQIIFKKVFDFVFWSLYRQKITLVIGQTDHELAVARAAHIAKKHVVVPLGIDKTAFTNLPSRSEARKKMRLLKQHIIYLYLGRFSQFKGLENLMRGFAKLAKNQPAAHLVLVGRDDGYLATIKKLQQQLKIKNCCSILKPLYTQDRFFAYRAADIFVSTPTEFEETSTTCLEALACGTPVITTHQAEIPFLSAADGVIYTKPQVNEIYQTLKKVGRHLPLSPVSQNKLFKLFAWQSVAQQITRLYE